MRPGILSIIGLGLTSLVVMFDLKLNAVYSVPLQADLESKFIYGAIIVIYLGTTYMVTSWLSRRYDKKEA